MPGNEAKFAIILIDALSAGSVAHHHGNHSPCNHERCLFVPYSHRQHSRRAFFDSRLLKSCPEAICFDQR